MVCTALLAGCDENEDDAEPDPETSDARGMTRGMHPVLVSRKGRSAAIGFAALAGAAAGVTAASADVAAAEDSAFAFQLAARRSGTASVLHAAGTLRDAMLQRQTAGHAADQTCGSPTTNRHHKTHGTEHK